MKLWQVSSKRDFNYDEFDAAIIAAETETDAAMTHPDGGGRIDNARGSEDCWPTDPAGVTVKFLGEAAGDVQAGVILASFNAG